MPPLHPLITERTTAATNLLIAVAVLGIILWLRRATPAGPRRAIWLAALGLLASGALLGVVAHGLALAPATLDAVWQPLYLALGGSVALFVVAAVADWLGRAAARWTLPVMLVVAAGFYLATRWQGGDFRVFVVYEAAAIGFTLAVYASLWRQDRLPGAGLLALAFAVSLGAGAVQATEGAALHIGWPLDHNGLFHLVQLAGLVPLGAGLRRSLGGPPG